MSTLTIAQRITNRIPFAIVRRNGHVDSFEQASVIKLADDDVEKPKLDSESAAFVSLADTRTGMGLRLDIPILREKTLAIIETMICDDAVGTYIELKKIGALSTPWHVQPADETPGAKEHADFVEYNFRSFIRGTLVNKLREILSGIEYGYSCTNKLHSLIESGPHKGKIGLRDLKTKPPERVTFDTDVFLNILDDGILYQSPDGKVDRLKRNEFVVYSYRSRFSNPYGWSDCIRAFDRWNSKRMRLKYWDIYLERHGCGTWIAKFDHKNPPTKDEHETVNSFLREKQARSGLKISTRWESIEAIEAATSSSDMWNGAIDSCNTQIARAIFQPDLVGFSEKDAGAYALGKKHFDFYMMILDSLREDITDVIVGDQIIKPLIDINYGPQDAYPKFVFDPLTSEQKVWWLSSVISAVEKGVLVADAGVMEKVRDLLELPAAEQLPAETAPPPSSFGGDIPPPDESDDNTPDDGFDPNAPNDDMQSLVESARAHDRIIVVGGPRTGKSMLSTLIAYKLGRAHRHTDSLVGECEWSELSERVSKWIDAPDKWVVEGVATVRALRKWLLANPEKPLPAAVLFMARPRVRRKKGQRTMGKGVASMWAQIEPELRRRGTTIIAGK